MTIGLFIPCYVDQLRPQVGLAVVRLFEALGFDFDYPEAQTCCGQPFVTAGEQRAAERLARRHAEVFAGYDVVVTPSGSCAANVRVHSPGGPGGERARAVAGRTRELCEFLVETGALAGRSGRHSPGEPAGGSPSESRGDPARHATRIGLHASCHALRELRHGRPSESRGPERADPATVLLSGIAGIELVALGRRDECCGFGGLFAVEEAAVSARMGLDRVADHAQAGAEIVTSTDVSCLLQLEGVARRRGLPLVFRHVAEILADAYAPTAATPPSTTIRGTDGPR